MTDLLVTVKAAVSGAASLMEFASGIKNTGLIKQTAELNLQLANIQNEAAALLNENRELKKELEYLKEDKANPLTFNEQDGLYYDSESKIPYCPNCYEGEKRERRHLKVATKTCPNCQEPFGSITPVISAVHPPKNSRFKI